jgi:hypothetical protein
MQNIIFSKNRPLQLDLTLKSIDKNWGGDTYVIYKADKKYGEGYKHLKQEHPKVRFIQQKWKLFNEIISIISLDYITFFTDDDVVFSYAGHLLNEEILEEVLVDSACLSLRLGVNVSKRDYGDGVLRDDNIPNFFPCSNNLLKWDRTSIPTGGYYSYPLSVDGHIFKKDLILPIIEEIDSWMEHCSRSLTFRCSHTPNDFESILQRFWFEVPVVMACDKFSHVVNSPNNRVQSVAKNRSGDKYPISMEDAYKIFMSGDRISLESLMKNLPNINCPHQELDLLSELV